MNLQRQHILLSYFKTLSVGPVWGSNPRPSAQQTGALPTELTRRRFELTRRRNKRANLLAMHEDGTNLVPRLSLPCILVVTTRKAGEREPGNEVEIVLDTSRSLGNLITATINKIFFPIDVYRQTTIKNNSNNNNDNDNDNNNNNNNNNNNDNNNDNNNNL